MNNDTKSKEIGSTNAFKVDWAYEGRPNLMVGVGATLAEKLFMYAGSLLLVSWFVADLSSEHIAWPVWQWVVAVAVCADIGGGVVANSLNSCKRFYHSPIGAGDGVVTRILKRPMLFTAFHVHTIIVSWIWDPKILMVGIGWYAALLAATFVTLKVPVYLQRPTGILFATVAIVATTRLPAVAQFEWLPGLIFIKLVVGHAVREEPYRPSRQ